MSTKPQAGEFCWNELMTSDVKKAKEFYSTLLGWTCQEHSMGTMTYTMFNQGDKSIGGMMQIPQDKKVSPHWMSYISVENVDMIIEKAQALGAQIIVPATVAGDFGRFTIVRDPTGAHIAFWQSFQS